MTFLPLAKLLCAFFQKLFTPLILLHNIDKSVDILVVPADLQVQLLLILLKQAPDLLAVISAAIPLKKLLGLGKYLLLLLFGLLLYQFLQSLVQTK